MRGPIYRVRIFTTLTELPFAGIPRWGVAQAWLQAEGPSEGEEIIKCVRTWPGADPTARQ